MRSDVLIEAVLFYKTEAIAKKELCSFLALSRDALDIALRALAARLASGATRLIDTGDTVQLVTAPEVAEVIEKLRTEELGREIGQKGAETLAIILYRGPLSRAQIDYIRGVNSASMLRTLQVRGLIERTESPSRAGGFRYAATPLLYAHLGIAKKEDLPEYVAVADELDTFARTMHDAETAPVGE